MRYVLLKLDDDATEKFVKKAGSRALGVWDIPSIYCTCNRQKQGRADNWFYEAKLGRRLCVDCMGPHKPVTTLGERLRMAFFGRNRIKDFR